MKCTKYLPNGVRLSAGYITEKDVKKEIQKACVIYAQSIIETPIKITVTIAFDNVYMTYIDNNPYHYPSIDVS